MTPEKKLLALKLSILSLTVVAVATNSTALILHSNNQMFTTSNSFTQCATLPAVKLSNIQGVLLYVVHAMMSAGIFFALCLAILMVAWLLKRQHNKTAAETKFRIPVYLLSALAVLPTSLAFGYYLSFALDAVRAGCSTVMDTNLGTIILLGISMALLLDCVILSLVLPKASVEETYHDRQDTEIELPTKQKSTNPQEEIIKIKLNDKSMQQYMVGQPPHEETSDELHGHLGKQLLSSELVNDRSAAQAPPGNQGSTIIGRPQSLTPNPPPSKVPSFDERKMEIVKQFRQSPISQLKREASPSNSGQKVAESPHQSPLNTHSRINEAETSPLNDFLSRHKAPYRPESPAYVPPPRYLPPIQQQTPAQPRGYDEPVQPGPSNQVPGLIRSRKRIFDRTTDKETYLRNELRTKYGMK